MHSPTMCRKHFGGSDKDGKEQFPTSASPNAKISVIFSGVGVGVGYQGMGWWVWKAQPHPRLSPILKQSRITNTMTY